MDDYHRELLMRMQRELLNKTIVTTDGKQVFERAAKDKRKARHLLKVRQPPSTLQLRDEPLLDAQQMRNIALDIARTAPGKAQVEPEVSIHGIETFRTNATSLSGRPSRRTEAQCAPLPLRPKAPQPPGPAPKSGTGWHGRVCRRKR